MASKPVFESMNAIRGIAAFIVVIDHCSTIGWFTGPAAERFVDYGPLAVDLFFVMSGFVIAHAYESRLSQGMRPSQFLLTRLVRLYPLYALGIGIGCLTPLASYANKGEIIGSQIPGVLSIPFAIAMLPSPIILSPNQILYPLNGPAWSLFFELLINGIYGLTWKYWTTRNILFVMTIAGLALLCCHDLSGGWGWANASIGLWRVMYSFPCGVLIYTLYRQGFRITINWAIVGAALICLIIVLPNFWGKAVAILGGFPLLIAASTQVEPGRTWAPTCAILGASSYAIYAIHDPLLLLTNNGLSKLSLTYDLSLVGIVFLCAIVPMCILADTVFDQPIRAWLKKALL